jgi:hypothetical protein
MGDRASRSFDLPAGDPGRFQRHQAVIAKGDRIATVSHTRGAPALLLAVDYSLGL